MTRSERLAIIAIVLAIAVIAWMNAASAADPFHIDAGDATDTLNEFSWQSGLQLLYDFKAMHTRRTNAVVGELESADALATMLKGTGLVFEFVNERTLAITVVATSRHYAAAEPARAELNEPVDENGYYGCTQVRYLYTLLGQIIVSTRDEYFCWRTPVVQR